MPSNYVIYTLPHVYIEYNCLNTVRLYIYLRSCLDLEKLNMYKNPPHISIETMWALYISTYIDIYRFVYLYIFCYLFVGICSLDAPPLLLLSTIATSRFQLPLHLARSLLPPIPSIYMRSLCALPTLSLHAIAIDLDYILGHIDKLIDESLAIYLGQYAALVIVAQRSAHRLVVHVRLVLVHAPQSGHRLGVDQLEDALLAVCPLDETRTILTILQQLEQELPQVCGGALATPTLHPHFQFGFARLFRLALLEAAQLQHVREIIVDARRRRLLYDALRGAGAKHCSRCRSAAAAAHHSCCCCCRCRRIGN